jgi:hypothetical protein
VSPGPLDEGRKDPAEHDAREDEQAHGDQKREADREAREGGHEGRIIGPLSWKAPRFVVSGLWLLVRATPTRNQKPVTRNLVTPRAPEDDSRLSSGKAVKAMLLLAGVVVAAAAVFVWVVITKACA